MNLIEKVARAQASITFDKQSKWPDRGSFRQLYVNTNWDQYIAYAQAAISAMPSIKWQKIETLPEEYKENETTFLVWDKLSYSVHPCIWVSDKEYLIKKYSHWAEINAPEEE